MQKLRRLLADGLLKVNHLVSFDWTSHQMGGASALVFAPHPDDEVLGCGGVIALKAQAGTRVQVVIMTDGRASHRALISEDELVRMRRTEAKEAALQLGLAADYIFLDFEDHRLMDHRDAACDRVVEIIDQFKPEEIYLPHRYDDIADHIETNRIVRRAVDRIGRPVVLLEYPVWLWNGWPWTQAGVRHGSSVVRCTVELTRNAAEIVFGCRARVDVSSVLQRKRTALAAYGSQLQRLNGDSRWPVLSDVADGEFLRRFETDVEIFRLTDCRPQNPRGSSVALA